MSRPDPPPSNRLGPAQRLASLRPTPPHLAHQSTLASGQADVGYLLVGDWQKSNFERARKELAVHEAFSGECGAYIEALSQGCLKLFKDKLGSDRKVGHLASHAHPLPPCVQ